MVEKTVMIGDEPVKLKAAGDMFRTYKREFGQDLMKTMLSFGGGKNLRDLKKTAQDGIDEDDVTTDAASDMIEVLMNLLWVFAKSADPHNVGNVSEWESQFVYADLMVVAQSDVLELFNNNMMSTGDVSKKKAIEKMQAING